MIEKAEFEVSTGGALGDRSSRQLLVALGEMIAAQEAGSSVATRKVAYILVFDAPCPTHC